MGRRLLWSVLFTVSRSISTELTINFLFSFSLSFPALLLLLQLLLLLLLLLILLLILSLLRLMVQFFFVVKHFYRINFLEMAPYPVTSGFSSRSHLVASINTSCCGCYHFGISPVHRLLVDLTALVITVLPALVACNLEYHHPFSSPTTCLSQRW